MIAVDTNVVLRLILADDERQLDAIIALLERARILVALTVLLEAGWVLQSRYRQSREDTANALEALLQLEGVEVADRALAAWALGRYRTGADLADMIHLAANHQADGFATLDRRLARDAGDGSPVPIETLA